MTLNDGFLCKCRDSANAAWRLLFMLQRELAEMYKATITPRCSVIVPPHLEHTMEINPQTTWRGLNTLPHAPPRVQYEERLRKLNIFSLEHLKPSDFSLCLSQNGLGGHICRTQQRPSTFVDTALRFLCML